MEKSTKRYKPWQVIYYEAYKSEKDAREREIKLKNHGNAVRELKKRIKWSLKNGAGFTLIEMVVAVAIFASVVTVASMLFASAIRAQRQNLALQELLDQTSYVMEYMSRAIRMAKKDDIATWGFPAKNCLLSGDKVNYEFTTPCLKFRNYKNECQEFCLEGTRLKENKDGVPNFLTSPELRVNSFDVDLTGEAQGDNFQPLVSILLDIEGKEKSKIQIQTSVSQRDLDIMR